jgi:hypothetical protein
MDAESELLADLTAEGADALWSVMTRLARDAQGGRRSVA